MIAVKKQQNEQAKKVKAITERLLEPKIGSNRKRRNQERQALVLLDVHESDEGTMHLVSDGAGIDHLEDGHSLMAEPYSTGNKNVKKKSVKPKKVVATTKFDSKHLDKNYESLRGTLSKQYHELKFDSSSKSPPRSRNNMTSGYNTQRLAGVSDLNILDMNSKNSSVGHDYQDLIHEKGDLKETIKNFKKNADNETRKLTAKLKIANVTFKPETNKDPGEVYRKE